MYIPIHMYYTITFAYKYTTYIGGRVKFLIMIFVISVTVTNALVIRLVGWLRKRKFYENGPIHMQQHKNEEKCSKNSSHPTKNFSQMLNLQKT